MRAIAISSFVAALVLTSCGESGTSAPAAQNRESASQATGFDAAFDKNFAESFLKSCVKGAVEKGAEPGFAQRACTCARDGVMKLDRNERIVLSEAKLRPIMESCRDNS